MTHVESTPLQSTRVENFPHVKGGTLRSAVSAKKRSNIKYPPRIVPATPLPLTTPTCEIKMLGRKIVEQDGL